MAISITNFIIESPAYVKYLVFLGALTVDATASEITGYSITGGVSWVIGQITGTNFYMSAPQFLLVAMCIGALMVVVKLKGAVYSK